MIPIVYIAGPYRASSRWDEEQNVCRAEVTAHDVALAGAMPVCPHANTRPYFSDAQPARFWLEGTLEILRRCDAVVMLPTWEQSEGARAERMEAALLGLPVFDHLDTTALKEWVEGFSAVALPPAEEK